jgi:hypothetical protein
MSGFVIAPNLTNKEAVEQFITGLKEEIKFRTNLTSRDRIQTKFTKMRDKLDGQLQAYESMLSFLESMEVTQL